MPALKYTIIPVTPFQQNCSLLMCPESKKAVLVDPGGDYDKIAEHITSEQAIVEKIILTHGHIDHAGQAKHIANTLGVTIEGPHKADQFWIERMPEQSAMFGFNQCDSFTPDKWLDESDTVTFGRITLQILHCPGHTPGHIIFYHPESQLAVVGDVLFKGGIGRTDFPMSNHDDLIHAIKHKLFKLGDDYAFIPGHGPMSTFKAEINSNPFVGKNTL